jgi:hypothetical protein
MKANVKTPILTVLAAAISCALPLAAGANDQADTDKHYSSNFAPIVDKVREAVLSLPKAELQKYGKILKTPCVTGPDYGAMGVHLINAENVDGIVDVNKPEALIYEPQSNGKLRIVGVEYIVPKEAWDALNPAQAGLPSPRPALLGNLMNFVDSPNRYGIEGGFFEIHVWAFEDNRKGALTDWNPDVTCEKQRLPRN